MRILNPSVEFIPQGDNIASHVARCARVCYGRESGNDEQTYNNLIKNGHLSMLRHATYYAIIPWSDKASKCIKSYLKCPYIDYKFLLTHRAFYVAANGNFMQDNKDRIVYELIKNHECKVEDFKLPETEDMIRYTFKVVTQISTSRELNRVSPNNIAEMSTRYVDLENGAIVRPHWMSEEDAEKWNSGEDVSEAIFDYLYSCRASFSNYRYLLKGHNFKREDARGVLPLDTATTVIYTYSAKVWRHIIDLRTSKRAHPNCRIIANMIKDELVKLGQGLGQELGQNI